MLKHRILTAIVLIPIFVFLVLKLSPTAFYIFTALIVLWGAWEWSFFMGIKQFPYHLIYPFFIIVVLMLAYLFPITSILYLALAWWLIATCLVIAYPKSNPLLGNDVVVRGLMGLFVLVPCWLAVNFIRNGTHGISILLFLFVLIWGADSGAYFAGKKWGRNKLIPEVSPGKTWEGFWGALLTTALIVVCGLVIFKVPYPTWPIAMLWCMLTVLFSILGDLFESMMKRRAGLKDSGHLLPGHGGILDRIDSLTAAAPVFALGLIISHWI
jgi:phosphatidate cytidylyltransferase